MEFLKVKLISYALRDCNYNKSILFIDLFIFKQSLNLMVYDFPLSTQQKEIIINI